MSGKRLRLFLAIVTSIGAAGCASIRSPVSTLIVGSPTVSIVALDAETKQPIRGATASGNIGDYGSTQPLALWGDSNRESDARGEFKVPLQSYADGIVEIVADGYQRKTLVNDELLSALKSRSQPVRVELLRERGPVILSVPEEFRGIIVVKFTAPSRVDDPPRRTPVRYKVPESGNVEVSEPGLFVPGVYYPPVQIQRGTRTPKYANDPDRTSAAQENVECLTPNAIRRLVESSNDVELQTRTDIVARMNDTCVYVLSNRSLRPSDIELESFDFGFHRLSPEFFRQSYFHSSIPTADSRTASKPPVPTAQGSAN